MGQIFMKKILTMGLIFKNFLRLAMNINYANPGKFKELGVFVAKWQKKNCTFYWKNP